MVTIPTHHISNPKTKVTIFIDGAHLYKTLKHHNVFVNFITVKNIVRQSVHATEKLHKVMYYDCEPSTEHTKEVDAKPRYLRRKELLTNLARLPLFAVRLGTLKKVGTKTIIQRDDNGNILLNEDRSDVIVNKKAIYTQKAVDVKLALDIAKVVIERRIERIILIAGDTDFIPAVKLARSHDVEVIVVSFNGSLSWSMREHCDIVRDIFIEPLLEDGTLLEFKKQQP